MAKVREMERLVRGHASRDGAGVNLTRIAGFRHRDSRGCMVYFHSGEGILGIELNPVRRGDLALLGKGDTVALAAAPSGCGFLLFAARPNNEPIARDGTLF